MAQKLSEPAMRNDLGFGQPRDLLPQVEGGIVVDVEP